MKSASRWFKHGVVLLSCLTVHPAIAASVELISVSTTEELGNDWSGRPSVSADGRYVVFQSDASNLIGDSNGTSDIFLRDRLLGVTQRVSIASSNGDSSDASISVDGRLVVFRSEASNLVPGDTNGVADIFVYDRQTGATERVSVSSAGLQANGGSGDSSSISADGRFVAFGSQASNLVPGDTNGTLDVFVRDRQMATTSRVSISSGGSQANRASFRPSISADGQTVAFYSLASNLIPGDTNGFSEVFVRNRMTGVTQSVCLGVGGRQANAPCLGYPSLSADGRFAAFRSLATNHVPDDTNDFDDIFVHDLQAGTTKRVSANSAGSQANGGSGDHPSVSANGRLVTFESDATNLAAGGAGVFVHALQTGGTERAASGTFPSISPDGRFVVFASDAANLVPEDDNGTSDIFLYDRGPQRSVKDDILIDFGNQIGLWQRMNDSSWIQIHTASPLAVATGDLDNNPKDEAIVTFPGAGLWARNNNASWTRLHASTPLRLLVSDLDGNSRSEIVVEFVADGIWARYDDGSWTRLHTAQPEDLSAGDLDGNGKNELIVDFGTGGLWARFNNATWAKLHAQSPRRMVTCDLTGNGRDELIADFNTGGLWVRSDSAAWTKLFNLTTEALAEGDLDGNGKCDLLLVANTIGLMARYDNGNWYRFNSVRPTHMLAADVDGNGKDDVVADLSPGTTLRVRYDTGIWREVQSLSTEGMAAGTFD